MARTDVLFMCVANSARSQMAEALAKQYAPEHVNIYSAGSAPSQVNPYATKALGEIGLSTENHTSNGIDDVPLETVGWVITLCAEEVCPYFPGDVERLHWPQPDPVTNERDPEAILARFRAVRNAIEIKVRHFFETEY
ncbi:MAG: arsenate reductase ArsC [Myxococcota bacterium]|nr:arsenate reductase ArsC [Myxococcota bacterium]